MPVAFLVGPLAAVIGLVAIFFVLRRKSVDKRSMYSARRSQIEHKVRAARQRTLTPAGRAEKQPEAPPEPTGPTSIVAPSPSAPRVTYEPSAYQPPPAAPPAPAKETGASPWDVPPSATPSPFAPSEPAPAPFAPSEPAPAPYVPPPPAPVEEVWVPAPLEPSPPSEVWSPAPAPAPAPAEPEPPVEPKRPATPAAAPGSWSVVSEAAKESAETAAQPRKKGKQDQSSSSWQLASGNAPGEAAEAEDEGVKTPSALVAIAQYAVLVVGLVMVLIGVFVMIANSHVT